MARRHEKVGYADLFAGPGVYADADGLTHKSTPVLVTEAAIADPLFRSRVHLWFNEGDRQNHTTLDGTIRSVADVKTLRYEPSVTDKVVDSRWPKTMAHLRVPTLAFLDPCGYKGLSLKLVQSIIQGFGNDCIFFFNYSRINMKLDLDVMNGSIDEFFEARRAAALRTAIEDKTPPERENLILQAVQSAAHEAGGKSCHFRFLSNRNRTSHHLFFVSKNQSAVSAMKRILNAASSEIIEGVGSGEHDPLADQRSASLFGGLYQVEEHLLSSFGGRHLKFQELLQEESQMRFTESNYRDAILNLESQGRVHVDPPAAARRFQAGGQKRTLPVSVHITFPVSNHHG